MKIYIDADGCPVVDITVRLAKKYHVGCVILCDTCHRIEREGAETIVVEKGADSVDFRLVNMLSAGDIAVTQDYGLAAMCLGRSALVINQDGKQYSDENISGLLEFRAIGKRCAEAAAGLKAAPSARRSRTRCLKKRLKPCL